MLACYQLLSRIISLQNGDISPRLFLVNSVETIHQHVEILCQLLGTKSEVS